jgi:hypothetical protein
MLIPLDKSWLCGNDHIGDSPVCCDCGSTALLSLGKVLNRVTADPVTLLSKDWNDFLGYNGICCELPSIKALWKEN